MQKVKSLYDISWQVSEEEYRADSALSYSTLAKYEREGFNNIDKLFDRIETPSLTFGSAVDSIITGGQEEFKDRFLVAEFPPVPDSIVKVVKSLFEKYKDVYNNLFNIPNNLIIEETEIQSYQLNWKPETRVKVLREKGDDYYNLLYLSKNKTIIDTQTYQDVINAVDTLRNNSNTGQYFAPNNPFEPTERLYQLKFKGEFNGINYRCMADLILVNYEKKTIIPVDLKTSSKCEWDFYKSFIDWNYSIQARLYWAIIRQNLDKDEYFKDFKLYDYRFIVINKKTLIPLVWICPFTQTEGTIKLGKNEQISLRSPFDIGEELTYYLNNRPPVPKGVSQEVGNDLKKWINTL